MAKVGEADPRWIVAERQDGQNVNAWHWTERDRTDWARERLESLCANAALDEQGCIKLGKTLDYFDGTVLLFNRKGKSGTVYNIEVRLSWKADFKDAAGAVTGKGKGTILVPEISDEAL
eukprot:SAG31_NODE_24884_length_472_cov_1.463807_1_plen_118_part_01